MNKIPDTSFDGNSVESSRQNENLAESTESEASEANITLFSRDLNIKRSELRPLSLLAIYFFLIYCYFSLLTPFFPGVAKSKGMNQVQVGCIFAIYQFVQIIISHLFGKHVNRPLKLNNSNVHNFFILQLFSCLDWETGNQVSLCLWNVFVLNVWNPIWVSLSGCESIWRYLFDLLLIYTTFKFSCSSSGWLSILFCMFSVSRSDRYW